jgi:hypothetical protein
MAAPQEMTGFEGNLFTSYQLLGQARTQMAVMHEVVPRCVDHCMDTDDLYTLRRATAPIGHRLKTDVEEKKCVANCSAKWDEMMRRQSTRLNQREVMLAQYKLMAEMQDKMAAGQAPQ